MADIASTTIEMQTPYEKWQIGEGIRSYRGFAVDLNIAEVDPCGSGTVGPRVLTPARRVPGSPPRSALRHPDEGPTFARLCGGFPGATRGSVRDDAGGEFRTGAVRPCGARPVPGTKGREEGMGKRKDWGKDEEEISNGC